MAWRETSEMEERMKFVLACKSKAYQMAELCRKYGISRQCGYKWWERYRQEGLAGVREHSRATQSCPHRTADEVVKVLIEERKRFGYGGKKIIARLRQNRPEEMWPAPTTADKYFRDHGLTEHKQRRRRRGASVAPNLDVSAPNQVWTVDFKGEFRLGNRDYCYPLTVVDTYSRYVLECRALKSTSSPACMRAFRQLFRSVGLPEAILSDNGVPFAQPALGRLSRLAVWWIKLGIRPLRIQPGHPEQNPRHERMHRELKRETTRPPARQQSGQQEKFDQFRRQYNAERPHEGLEMKRPVQLYQASGRCYPEREPQVEYPGHFEVRRVSSGGTVKLRNRLLFVTRVLESEYVGLEAVDDAIWSVYFGPQLLGRLDERTGKIYE